MNTCYLSTGSNIGNRLAYLQAAQRAIVDKTVCLTGASTIYETAAWGNTNQANFYNQALMIQTSLSPSELLAHCQSIENQYQRQREQHWGARTLDIDILFYNDWIVHTKNLILPHPLLQERNFVLVPLCELKAHLVHPTLGKTIEQLMVECKDKLEVQPVHSPLIKDQWGLGVQQVSVSPKPAHKNLQPYNR